MIIDKTIDYLKSFVKLHGITSLFIAGDYCRSLFIDQKHPIKTVDVISAIPEQAQQIGALFATEVLKSTPVFSETFSTAIVEYRSEKESVKIEFQGDSPNQYMHNDEVLDWMELSGIEDVPLMNNLYGRDFTINSMTLSIHNGNLYDPTGKAKSDFEKRLIRSLLPPDILMKYNPLAALRAIRFGVEYDFYIETGLRLSIEPAIDLLPKMVTRDRIVEELVDILKTDPEKGLEAIKRFDLQRFLIDKDVENIIGIEH